MTLSRLVRGFESLWERQITREIYLHADESVA